VAVTVAIIGDAAGDDGHDGSDSTADLPTLEDLFSEARAMRCMAVAELSPEPQKPTDPEHLGHSPGGSQGEQPTIPYFLPFWLAAYATM